MYGEDKWLTMKEWNGGSWKGLKGQEKRSKLTWVVVMKDMMLVIWGKIPRYSGMEE